VCAGFYCEEQVIRIEAETGRTLARGSLALTNLSTNRIEFFFPPAAQRDELILKDSEGRMVPRTHEGETIGISLPAVLERHEWKKPGYFLFWLEPRQDYEYLVSLAGSGDANSRSTMNLGRYFCITNPGTYELTRYARICFRGTNYTLNPIVLPPVSIPVLVERRREGGAR
jgi:hypothetical protein